MPRNKKPERLRDTLRECDRIGQFTSHNVMYFHLQELLASHQPIAMKWKGLRHCLVSETF